MKECLLRLIKNINKLQKLPVKRYSWDIEMAILNLDIEIGEFIRKYENNNLNKIDIKQKINKTKYYPKRVFPN